MDETSTMEQTNVVQEIKTEIGEEETVGSNNEDNQSGSSGSEASEGYVKVDPIVEDIGVQPAPIPEEESEQVVTKPMVEKSPATPDEKTPMEQALLEHLDSQVTDYVGGSGGDYVEEAGDVSSSVDEVETPDQQEDDEEEKETKAFSCDPEVPFNESVPITENQGPLMNSRSPVSPSGDEKEVTEEPFYPEEVQPDEVADIDLVGGVTNIPDLPEVESVEEEPVEIPDIDPVVEEVPREEPPVQEKPETVAEKVPTEEPSNSPEKESKCFDPTTFFKYPKGGGGKGEGNSDQLEDPAFTVWKERIVDIIYWRDLKLSAVIFTLSLLVLLSLQCHSIISVVAYFDLALLAVTITFRLYKFVLQTLNGTQQPNPFQRWLDADITISSEQLSKYTDAVLGHVNCTLATTRDLILVKSTAASIKFGIALWLITYVGCCFDGLTLLTIVFVLAFALPPLYEKYQEPIDTHYGTVKSKVEDVVGMIRSKVPGMKPKAD